MSLSPEQHELRTMSATATDVPAIANVHPYRSPLDVWLTKTGRAPEGSVSAERAARMRWGNLLEPLLRDDFSERNNVSVVGPVATIARQFGGVLIAATPDGIIEPWGAGWEGKTHSVGVRSLYGSPMTDEVPVYELLQCQTGMLVTGLRAWRLTTFIDNTPTDYAISADDTLHGQIVEMTARWWRDHVVADRAPDPNARDHETLSALHPRDSGLIRSATEDERALALDLKRALADGEAGTERVEELRAQLKAAIGDDAGLTWGLNSDETITWRKSRDSRVTDWQHAAYDFAGRVQLAASSTSIIDAIEVLRHLAAGKNTFKLEGGNRVVGCMDLAESMATLLAEIKRGIDIAASSTSKPGSRRFLTPKGWK